VTLQEACDIVFRGAIKVSTLRLEADAGMSRYSKSAGASSRRCEAWRGMTAKCQEKRRGRASTLTESGSNGLSEMDRVSSALVALKQTTRELKSASRNTSQQSIARSRRVASNRRRPAGLRKGTAAKDEGRGQGGAQYLEPHALLGTKRADDVNSDNCAAYAATRPPAAARRDLEVLRAACSTGTSTRPPYRGSRP